MTPLADGRPWHTLSAADAAALLNTDLARGLTPAEATVRLQRDGSNALRTAAARPAWRILLDQFVSLIVLLLVAATGVAFALGDTAEAVAILAVILLNALIGFFTEWRAGQALAALQKQAVPVARVIRDGREQELPAVELVAGDVVLLTAGDRVPADGRVVESVRLQVDEASLTGESVPVSKTADPLPDPDLPLADRANMLYLGTAVTAGRGRLLVTAIGARTEMGRIGTLLDEATAGETPLERKLAQLGRALVGIVLVLCAVIVVAGWLRGNPLLPMIEVGISLAIAAVPEGLPAVATMTLALGMQRMARMRALIRRLPAVETLGATTVIGSDKTGTLTRNEMTVRAYRVAASQVEVTGAGYQAAGDFRVDGRPTDPRADEPLLFALRIGALCNDARVERGPDGERVFGDPTEAALIVAAEKAGLARDALAREYPRIGEQPFDSTTKRMTTVHRGPDGRTWAFVKGSPGRTIDACDRERTARGEGPLTDARRQEWRRANEELAGAALRVLALAYRDLPASYSDDDLSRGLVLAGLVGMIDPLRDEAKAAIATCREAGIRAVMITGDQPATAAEIARQLGLGGEKDSPRVVGPRELDALDDAGWKTVVADASVFARVTPEHKLRIVEALQARGEVVAMTGDGVNDAPALKKADIGVAMGIKGTEVAKEAAAMVITDDNFATIVRAVEQGRIIYANIQKFVHYLFSCNLAEILTVFVAILVGWPLPLYALQILWLNLVTDVFPAMALALEPSSPGLMKRPPRDPKEPLLTPRFMWLIGWQGGLLAILTLAAYATALRWHGRDSDPDRAATTVAFLTLALGQVVHAFNARSQNRSAFGPGLFTNAWLWAAVGACVLLQIAAVSVPLLQRVLHTAWPSPADWAVIVACSLAPLVIVEVEKLVHRTAARG